MKEGAEKGHDLLHGLDRLRQTLETQIETIRSSLVDAPQTTHNDARMERLRHDLGALETANTQAGILHLLLASIQARCRRSQMYLVRDGQLAEWPRKSGDLRQSEEWLAIVEEGRPKRLTSNADETALIPFVLRGRTAAVVAVHDHTLSDLPLDEIQILCHCAAQSLDLLTVREGHASALFDIVEAATAATDDAILAGALEAVDEPITDTAPPGFSLAAPTGLEFPSSEAGPTMTDSSSDSGGTRFSRPRDQASLSPEIVNVMKAVEMEISGTSEPLPVLAGDLNEDIDQQPPPADLDPSFDEPEATHRLLNQPAELVGEDSENVGEDSENVGEDSGIGGGDSGDLDTPAEADRSEQPIDPDPPGGTAYNPEIASIQDTLVAPPSGLEGPGSAFAPADSGPDQGRSEEAQRLARLLVSEIELYNREELLAGRRHGDIVSRLKDDIERARSIYTERIDPQNLAHAGWFDEELVRVLALGDASLLGH